MFAGKDYYYWISALLLSSAILRSRSFRVFLPPNPPGRLQYSYSLTLLVLPKS